MARFSLLGYYKIKCHSECVSINQRPGQPSWIWAARKNIDLVEDIEILLPALEEGIEILLPAKSLWIPFSGFRGEVENVKS